jgi:hypothetical protein
VYLVDISYFSCGNPMLVLGFVFVFDLMLKRWVALGFCGLKALMCFRCREVLEFFLKKTEWVF